MFWPVPAEDEFFTKMLLAGYCLPQSLGQYHPSDFSIFNISAQARVPVNKTTRFYNQERVEGQ